MRNISEANPIKMHCLVFAMKQANFFARKFSEKKQKGIFFLRE
jgi:hypothetical protein